MSLMQLSGLRKKETRVGEDAGWKFRCYGHTAPDRAIPRLQCQCPALRPTLTATACRDIFTLRRHYIRDAAVLPLALAVSEGDHFFSNHESYSEL